MKKSIRFAVVVSAIGSLLFGAVAFGAGNTDTKTLPILAAVVKALKLTKVRDLDFGSGFTGDSAKTIAPADADSAQFSVAGAPSTAFTITFSAASTTLLLGGAPSGGDANKEIVVDTFNHDAGGSPTLDVTGAKSFGVGAKRAALAATQAAGSYTGSLDVTVTY